MWATLSAGGNPDAKKSWQNDESMCSSVWCCIALVDVFSNERDECTYVPRFVTWKWDRLWKSATDIRYALGFGLVLDCAHHLRHICHVCAVVLAMCVMCAVSIMGTKYTEYCAHLICRSASKGHKRGLQPAHLLPQKDCKGPTNLGRIDRTCERNRKRVAPADIYRFM